jgi:DNA polymerase-3 subunit gamma/tau
VSSFYNKYVPKTFSEVYDQDITVLILKNIIKKQEIPNGIIFNGIHGVGKTLLAKIFAKAINCMNSNEEKPCLSCEMCINIDNGCEDIIEIDGATYTGIDNIRKIIDDTMYVPMTLKYKIYIIDEVHMLSRSAFDALLMILHEPPSYIKFLFATTKLEKLPDTFLSRCLTLPLSRVSNSKMLEILKNIINSEENDLDDEILALILKISSGSVRSALSILELILLFKESTNEPLDLNKISNYLKIFSSQNCIEILKLILNGNPKEAINYWRDLYNKGYDEKTFLHSMSNLLTNLSLVKLGEKVEDEEIYKDILNSYNISFQLLINFWEILLAQTEVMYSGFGSIIESTILMISLIEDKTQLTHEAKRVFAGIK